MAFLPWKSPRLTVKPMPRDVKVFLTFVGVFLVAFYLPLSSERVSGAILEAFKLLQWYARNHTLACVVPALFIAGGIATFLSKSAVLEHLGPRASKVEAYSVAAVSGSVLSVCSCSVLPVFAGIHRMGAGLGPATAFLYSGPAINVLALVLTARVLGLSMGLWRAIGAVVFAVVIGVIMDLVFRRGRSPDDGSAMAVPEPESSPRPLWKTVLYFTCMIAFLVFSDWYNPGHATIHRKEGDSFTCVVMRETSDELVVQLKEPVDGRAVEDRLELPKTDIESVDIEETWVTAIHGKRWYLAAAMGLAVLLMAWRWFSRDEVKEWMRNTWYFAKLLIPLLFGGVFLVGFLGALVPDEQVAALVGDNSVWSNLVASVVGCLFYFATLTEIPVLEALMKHGMAPGPAMALLLAGPALSLPSLLVIRSVLGTAKTAVFTVLVVVMATITGLAYGAFT